MKSDLRAALLILVNIDREMIEASKKRKRAAAQKEKQAKKEKKEETKDEK